ncbi:MAG: SPOR domain-containing protein [Ignavibacteriales bacterium]|nr:MAG: SPOR domain-containing protein [Ignavibacteriales bacterium]
MKLAELQKKVTDVLGVSVSQKELSFEIFMENISEVLGEGITLKVPRIGFFQQKAVSTGNDVSQLIFSPLPEDFTHEMHNLYLTIEVLPKVKTKLEFDATVFSIGVGKPLLPLSIDEFPDTETSYAMLRKSIEERVKELIAESDQIPNFNIWDDYYKSPEDYETEKLGDIQSQLTELTADINYKDPTEPGSIPNNFFEDNVSKTINDERINTFDDKTSDKISLQANEEDKFSDLDKIIKEEKINITKEEADSETSSPESNSTTEEEHNDYSALEETEVSAGSLTVADLLDDSISIPKEKLHVQNEVSEPEISSPLEIPIDKVDETETENKFIDLKETETENKIFERKETEAGDKIIDLGEKDNSETIVDEKENVDDETEDEDLEREQPQLDEKIEWNWGDELKDEFGVIIEEEANFEMVDQFNDDDNLELIDQKVGTDKKFTRDLFKELEKTLEREINEEEERLNEDRLKYSRRLTNERSFRFKKPTDEYSDNPKKVVLEFSGPPVKYEFIEDRRIGREKNKAITLIDENDRSYEDDYNKLRIKPVMKEKDNYFNKTFILIFSAFVIVTSIIIYLIMRGNNPNEPQQTKLDANNSQQPVQNTIDSPKIVIPNQTIAKQNNSTQNKNVSSQPINDELSDFPISATPPVPIKQEKALQNQESKTSSNNLRTEPKTKPENNDLYKTPAKDTRVNKSIYFDGKNYSYQTSSWPRKLRAEQEVKRLRALGINAFIVEAYLPQKGGTWYRVRVGSFNSEKETQDYINKNKF